MAAAGNGVIMYGLMMPNVDKAIPAIGRSIFTYAGQINFSDDVNDKAVIRTIYLEGENHDKYFAELYG